MGDLRFQLAEGEDFDPRIWSTAYITGLEGIPWQCHHSRTAGQFNIGREIDESGKLNIVWPTAHLGPVCLSTTSLRVTDTPYSLVAELARGTVSRLKNQTSEWERMGLKVPHEFYPQAEHALDQLLQGLTSQDPGKAAELAQASIESSMQAIARLCNGFSRQALESRRSNEGRLSTLLGVKHTSTILPHRCSQSLDQAFNLVGVAPEMGLVELASGKTDYSQFDQQIAWASERSKKICVGPLVNFRRGALPQWMVLLDQGFESILKAACDHVERTVARYRGRVHLWNCGTALNVPNELHWNDEEILRMAVSLIESVRQADDRTPVLLTIDQPWSEYLRNDSDGISPLHFADALIRAELGLSGLTLQLDFDHWPGGSFPRDPIELGRLIDRWSMLGLPLMVILSTPTLRASEPVDSRTASWFPSTAERGIVDPASMVSLLLSKPSVHAVIWNNLLEEPCTAPSSSLYDKQFKPKPLIQQLAELRGRYLY